MIEKKQRMKRENNIIQMIYLRKNNQLKKLKNVENYNENLPIEVKKNNFYQKIINFFKRFFNIN